MSNYDPELDFNFEEDAIPPALIPNGTYHGAISSAVFDPEKKNITWKVTLSENGGVCSDNETEIDGQTLTFSNWLPKPGDEKEMTTSGKMNKRQAKINMMAEFMKKMQFEEKTVGEVLEAIENSEYTGRECDVQVGVREWQGSVFNEIQKMYVPVGATF